MEGMQGQFGSFTDRRDRRRHLRKSPSSIIYAELCKDTGGIVLDLGEGGLSMTTAAAINEKYYPHIRFRLPSCAHSIETSGQIIWLAESKNRAGIQFVDLTEDARIQIKNWISSERFPHEIQDTLIPIQRKRMHLDMPVPGRTRMMVPERVMVREADEMKSIDDLFPSESAPSAPPEVQAPAVIPAQDAIPQSRRYVADSILGLGRGTSNDRPDSTTEPRSRFRLAAYGVLIGAVCFTIGVATGNGPMQRLLLDIEKMISRGGKSGSDVVAPQADSIAGPAISSLRESPQQASETSTEPSRLIPGPDHDGLPNNNVRQPADGSAVAAPRRTGAAEKSWARMEESQRTMLVTAPSEGSRPIVLTLPERAVSASPLFAISSQRSITVPPEPGAESFHRPKRLRVGELIFHVEPRFPRVGDGPENTIKLRATVGDDGRIIDIKAISGPPALFPSAMSVIREWRYRPTILNGQPIRTQEDILIVFRGH
jgi:Gram-negative bacterial TonB protein C-terminal/PilZ domain